MIEFDRRVDSFGLFIITHHDTLGFGLNLSYFVAENLEPLGRLIIACLKLLGCFLLFYSFSFLNWGNVLQYPLISATFIRFSGSVFGSEEC